MLIAIYIAHSMIQESYRASLMILIALRIMIMETITRLIIDFSSKDLLSLEGG